MIILKDTSLWTVKEAGVPREDPPRYRANMQTEEKGSGQMVNSNPGFSSCDATMSISLSPPGVGDMFVSQAQVLYWRPEVWGFCTLPVTALFWAETLLLSLESARATLWVLGLQLIMLLVLELKVPKDFSPGGLKLFQWYLSLGIRNFLSICSSTLSHPLDFSSHLNYATMY